MLCEFRCDRPSQFYRSEGGCQFAESAQDLVSIDGAELCPFHLPLASRSGRPTEKASWNREQIGAFNASIQKRIVDADGEPIDLTGVVFPGSISFQNVDFESEVSFVAARFRRRAHFNNARFAKMAAFVGTEFAAGTEFYYVQFQNFTQFDRAWFGGETWFPYTKFSGQVWFRNAVFEKFVRFDRAEFHREVNFETSVEAGVSDEGRTVTPDLFGNFSGAVFHGEAKFTNRRFPGITIFRGVKFHVAPEFHGCVLHQDTDLSDADFLDTGTAGAARAYRTLKRAMEETRSWQQQAEFFALEQKSLRQRDDTPRFEKILSWLYDVTASYGRSCTRPLACLLGSFAVFFAIYWATLAGAVPTWGALDSTLEFTLRQLFRPFETLRANGSAIPIGLALLTALHSLTNFSLVALFLLALRRRFKMS